MGSAPDGGFTVKSAYETLLEPPLEEINPVFKSVWKSAAPSNVISFTWRTILDRIQTKSNLNRRGISVTSMRKIHPTFSSLASLRGECG